MTQAVKAEPSAIVGAESISLAMLNAIAQQQLGSMVADAATTMAVATMLSIAAPEFAGNLKKSELPTEPEDLAGYLKTGKWPSPPTAAGSSATQHAPVAEGTIAKPTSSTDMTASAESTEPPANAATRMIAQTLALTVQDAANNLRHIRTLSTASIALALLQRNTVDRTAEGAPALDATLINFGTVHSAV